MKIVYNISISMRLVWKRGLDALAVGAFMLCGWQLYALRLHIRQPHNIT